MACNFTIRSKHDLETAYAIALREIKRMNVYYDGDLSGGKFRMRLFGMGFKGNIRTEGNHIVVEITEKLMLIACSLIEVSVKRYVEDLQI